ncbi:TPA: hypothetical protein ACH3X3_008088 [Trebouxia sp. C0006]
MINKECKTNIHSVMALKSSLCTTFAPALERSNLTCTKPLSLQSRAPRTYQRIMPSAAAITKGQEQFVDDKSQFGALQGVKTPLALLDRVRKNGGKEIRKVMSNWKFWIPTKKGQSTQQGGAFIFKGETCVWQYFDPATAAHVNAQQLLKRVLEIAGKN